MVGLWLGKVLCSAWQESLYYFSLALLKGLQYLHFMDRFKVPVHHKWKAAYYTALQEGIFSIIDYGYKKQVENILVRKGKTWHEQASFNFRYIAQQAR
jgi:hypothetical protein